MPPLLCRPLLSSPAVLHPAHLLSAIFFGSWSGGSNHPSNANEQGHRIYDCPVFLSEVPVLKSRNNCRSPVAEGSFSCGMKGEHGDSASTSPAYCSPRPFLRWRLARGLPAVLTAARFVLFLTVLHKSRREGPALVGAK